LPKGVAFGTGSIIMKTQSMTNGVKNMKVFKFDPQTGKRGELVDEIRLPSCYGQSIEFAQSKGVQTHLSCTMPKSYGDTRWESHIYMGRDDDEGNFVPQQYDFWVCCCSGRENGTWVWNVIPPYKALTKKSEAA
jgi:hypothetical protein